MVDQTVSTRGLAWPVRSTLVADVNERSRPWCARRATRRPPVIVASRS